jgi:hypothetical protein
VVRMAGATNSSLLQSQGYAEIFQLDFLSADKLSSEFGTAWNSAGQLAFSAVLTNPAAQTVLFLAEVNSLSGDYDGDGDVDGRDFLVWQRTDGTSAGLAAWQAEYGTGSGLSAVAAVPEPTSAILLIASGSVMTRTRRRATWSNRACRAM